MSKTLQETPLSTRAARDRLSKGLHWRSLDRDVHLGYRKGVRTGRWLVRWRAGAGYKQAPLANADDALEADGKETLSFDQALKGARDHVVRMRAGPTEKQPGPAPKVREVALAYAAAIDARQKAAGGFVWGDTCSRLKNYVLSHAIANIELPKLTEAHIQTWRESLGSRELSPASVKTGIEHVSCRLVRSWTQASAPAGWRVSFYGKGWFRGFDAGARRDRNQAKCNSIGWRAGTAIGGGAHD